MTSHVRLSVVHLALMFLLPLAGLVPQTSPSPAPTGNATLTITLRDCPIGIDPAVNPKRCSTPVDDKGTGILLSDELGFGARLSDAEHTEGSGKYVFSDLAEGTYRLQDVRMSEPRRFWVEGAQNRESFRVTSDKDAEITVYFFQPEQGVKLSDVQTGRLFVKLISCPQGVDPRQKQDQCTYVLKDDGTARVNVRATGDSARLIEQPQTPDGAYIVTCPAREDCTITGMAPTNGRFLFIDGTYTFNEAAKEWTFTVRRLENQYATFYYYNV